MSVVKINAITVPADSGDALAQRFAARTRAMDGVDGFFGFELLRPTDGRLTWLVVTRWRDEVAYEAWVGSESFAAGHRRPAAPDGAPPDGGTPDGGAPDRVKGASDGRAPDDGPRRPVGVSAELWSFDVADGSGVD